MVTIPMPTGTRPLGLSARLRDMGGGRGGPRQPKNPAAVSTPGSGRRTDGGAGSKSQPLRIATGGAYGETKAATEQQKAAPLASGGPTGGTGAPAPPIAPGGGVGGRPEGVFGPTEQPNVGPGGDPNSPRQMLAENPEMFLRQLYAQFPTAQLGALLRRGGQM